MGVRELRDRRRLSPRELPASPLLVHAVPGGCVVLMAGPAASERLYDIVLSRVDDIVPP